MRKKHEKLTQKIMNMGPENMKRYANLQATKTVN